MKQKAGEEMSKSREEWAKEESTIKITNRNRHLISMFLAMSKGFREKERAAWEELAKEVNEDGTQKYKNADGNAAFWGMVEEAVAALEEAMEEAVLEK